MLNLLKINNIALVSDLTIEFGDGLNLLTGETGSGKSIIVDSLGALTGERVSNDLIKQGEDSARIEGLFIVPADEDLKQLLDDSGIEQTVGDELELIVRRELSLSGKNRVFVNDHLVTQGFLRQLGPRLAAIHGQGEQALLYDVSTHLSMLDELASVESEISAVRVAYEELSRVREELDSLKRDEAEKLQLADILKFQINEISMMGLNPGEDTELEDEKLRLNNVEKISALSNEAFSLLYDDERSSLATLDRASKIVAELAEYDSRFRGFDADLAAARSVVAELGTASRDVSESLDFSPSRLDEIEDRLAEISRLKRKYGGTVESVLEHLNGSQQRLSNIETAELREAELQRELAIKISAYTDAASRLHDARVRTADKFSKAVERELKDVALEKARFEPRVESIETIGPTGSDSVEFHFSANPGEPLRPLAKVASGGEASRLMLILKSAAHSNERGMTSVFDEIDVGIGGRVAEAVGRKLKSLSATGQVLCVTHQPQIASLADRHFVVEKDISGKSTSVTVRELDQTERVDEIARMLAGEQVTDAARENAKAMLAAAR